VCWNAGSYWEKVKEPLQELLDRNNITSAANITLQMIGGGSRIPRVQAELAKVLEGLSLEKQLDADEAPAMGAGLMAANLSTTFRLRQFGMQDGLTYPISISLEPGEGVPDIHSVRRCLLPAPVALILSWCCIDWLVFLWILNSKCFSWISTLANKCTHLCDLRLQLPQTFKTFLRAHLK
jgi:Hsp70 protein